MTSSSSAESLRMSWSPAFTEDRSLSTDLVVTTSSAKQDHTVTTSSSSSSSTPRLRAAPNPVHVAPAASSPPLIIHHGDRRSDFMEPTTYDSYGGVRTAATLVSLILIVLIGILYRERVYVGRRCRDLVESVRPVGLRHTGDCGGGQAPYEGYVVEPPMGCGSVGPSGPAGSPLGGDGGELLGVLTTDVGSLVEKIML